MPRARSESGFTLPEVLVVTIVIGILAAIALPTMLGQVDAGHDASAKSDAAVVTSLVEACHATSDDYRECDSEAEIATDGGASGVSVGPGPGEVEIDPATANTFRVVAHSRSGATFSISRPATGPLARTCDAHGRGGCPSGGSW